ncbi:MAG: TatD family hydrolase [Oscillospiraceae bacterium]|nr:TatD family hydrolase [Oscillospiraceae bacterium]
MLIDVHAHYDDKRYDGDRDEVIQEVKKSGVDIVINSGSSIKSSKTSSDLAKKYDFIYASVGVHPHETEKTPDDTLDILADLLTNKKVAAIGEIGLDFFHDFSNRDSQRRWFKKQMDFAADVKYPVVIHDRDAHGESLETVKKYGDKVKGVFHCYAGSVEMAKELINLGYMMSFGGVCTFANAKTCRDVLKEIPAEYILLETDCPYLAPEPRRGERNDSRNLHIIAAKIAEIKNMPVEQLILKTGENARNCFNLKIKI